MTGEGRKCQVNLALRGRAGRDAGRGAPGPVLLAFTELAARLLTAAAEAAGESAPRCAESAASGWTRLTEAARLLAA